MGPSGGLHHGDGRRRCSGGRTRTLNNWTRTSRVADYTTPEWVDVQISRAASGAQSAPLTRRGARCIAGRPDGMMRRPGSPGGRIRVRRSVGMYRWSAAAIILAGLVVRRSGGAGACGRRRRASRSRSPRTGASSTARPSRSAAAAWPESAGGSRSTWFATECTAAVQGPDEPLRPTRPTATSPTPGPLHVAPQRHLLGPLPRRDRDHRRRLLRHPRARRPASSAWAPPRAWAPS